MAVVGLVNNPVAPPLTVKINMKESLASFLDNDKQGEVVQEWIEVF